MARSSCSHEGILPFLRSQEYSSTRVARKEGSRRGPIGFTARRWTRGGKAAYGGQTRAFAARRLNRRVRPFSRRCDRAFERGSFAAELHVTAKSASWTAQKATRRDDQRQGRGTAHRDIKAALAATRRPRTGSRNTRAADLMSQGRSS